MEWSRRRKASSENIILEKEGRNLRRELLHSITELEPLSTSVQTAVEMHMEDQSDLKQGADSDVGTKIL